MNNLSESTDKPRPDQLRDLRRESQARGMTFAWPQTSAEAEAELARLRGEELSSFAERAIERRSVGRDMAERGGESKVRGSEIEGYGSSAHWKAGSR